MALTEMQLFEESGRCQREKVDFRSKTSKLKMQRYHTLCCNLDEGFGSVSTQVLSALSTDVPY